MHKPLPATQSFEQQHEDELKELANAVAERKAGAVDAA